MQKAGSEEPAFGVKLIHDKKPYTTRLYTKSGNVSTGFANVIRKNYPQRWFGTTAKPTIGGVELHKAVYGLLSKREKISSITEDSI